MIRSWNCIVSNVRVLIFDNFTNEVAFVLIGWMAGTSLIRMSVNVSLGCSVILLYDIGMDSLTVIFIVDS